MSRRLRWGVLGTARIATRKVIPGMQQGRWTTVDAIASRDGDRARRSAAELGIPKAYGSYEALLDDPDIDAVYNPLPNHLHVPFAARAAEAGKHVLCEKPIALDAAEARTLLAVRDRTGRYIQEAFMVRTHPQWEQAIDLARGGTLGEIVGVMGAFSYFNDDPANIRNVPAFGGGGLMDIGCYLVMTSRMIFGETPARAVALLRMGGSGVDRQASLLLDYSAGQAVGMCGTRMTAYQRSHIYGTRARVEIEIPFNAPPDRPCRLWIDDGSDLSGAGRREVTVPVCDQYGVQGDRFSRAILDGTPQPYPLEESIANMTVIDALFRSADTGCWETVNSNVG